MADDGRMIPADEVLVALAAVAHLLALLVDKGLLHQAVSGILLIGDNTEDPVG